MATAVYVRVLALANDVATAVCRAPLERSALPPVEVDEAQFAEQLKAEFFELRLVEAVELELLHIGDGSLRGGRTST